MGSVSASVFPLLHLEEIAVRPVIAYRGPVVTGNLRMRVRHPFFTWWWVECGRVEVTWSDGAAQLGPGDWIFFPRNQPRAHRIEPGTELLSFSFTLDWPDGGGALHFAQPVRGAGDRSLHRLGAGALAALEPGAAHLSARRATLMGGLEFRAGLLRLVTALVDRALAAGAEVRPRSATDPRLQPILDELAREPRLGPLPFARWCAAARLGRTQLDRLARAHCGLTLRGWRDRLVAAEVRRRLDLGRESLKEIAAALGFADAAHFNHWVRRHLGTSPSRWRSQGV